MTSRIEEVDAEMRRHAARREQAEASPIAQLASACSTVAWRWLRGREGHASCSADPVVAEAFEIAAWDAGFIEVKLARALQGRLEFAAGDAR